MERACSASAIASSMAARGYAGPAIVTPGDRRTCGRWSRWRRCISPTTSRRSTPCPNDCPTCRRSPVSTPAFIAATRRRRRRPAAARRFGDAGVQRYGFHGLSYEYVASALPQLAPEIAGGRVIVAHLGSGASLCALDDGRSIDSSLGFTALDGLCMGTRPGTLDPGVVLYLFQGLGFSAKEVESLLYKQSGLLGLSGISNDMRDLLTSAEPAAKLAVDYFVYRAAKEIGALAAVLSGIDGLVFTAGIGENSPELRARICNASSWLGIELDRDANARGGPRISAPRSRVSAWVVRTDEELMIARHTAAQLGLVEPTTGMAMMNAS